MENEKNYFDPSIKEVSMLVSFGKYLLSKERKQLIKGMPHYQKGDLKEVYHSDVENWKARENIGVKD